MIQEMCLLHVELQCRNTTPDQTDYDDCSFTCSVLIVLPCLIEKHSSIGRGRREATNFIDTVETALLNPLTANSIPDIDDSILISIKSVIEKCTEQPYHWIAHELNDIVANFLLPCN